MGETWIYGAISASFFTLTLVGTLFFKARKAGQTGGGVDFKAMQRRAKKAKVQNDAEAEEFLAERELQEAEKARRERRDRLRGNKP